MSCPPSVQINRLNVYPHAYTVTNGHHNNNRPVIVYSAEIKGQTIEEHRANDAVKAMRKAKRDV